MSALRSGENERQARWRERTPQQDLFCGAERSSAASKACAPRKGLGGEECHPTRPPARGSQQEFADSRGSTSLLHELFSWIYRIQRVSPLSIHGVGSLGTMAGMPGSTGTSLPAVPCTNGSLWRAARRTRGSYWFSVPQADGTGPRIPGSLRTSPGRSWSHVLRPLLGTSWGGGRKVCENSRLWSEGL